MECVQIIVLILTTFTALGALGAAFVAWCSVRATRLTSAAQLSVLFMNQYGSPEMCKALRTLRNWKSKHPNDFFEIYCKDLKKGDPEALEVDAARRRVKYYFLPAARLRKNHFISKKLLKVIACVDGIQILFDISEPLEYCLDPDHDPSELDKLREIYGHFGANRSYPSVPSKPATRQSTKRKVKKV